LFKVELAVFVGKDKALERGFFVDALADSGGYFAAIIQISFLKIRPWLGRKIKAVMGRLQDYFKA
jgi:hypothetical protein